MRTEAEQFYDYIGGMDEWSIGYESGPPNVAPALTVLVHMNAEPEELPTDHDSFRFWQRFALSQFANMHEVPVADLKPEWAARYLNEAMAVLAVDYYGLPHTPADIDSANWDDLPWFTPDQVEKLISQ